MNLPTLDQGLSWGRHGVTALVTAATTLGLVKVGGVDLSVLSTSMDHIFAGIKEISIGLGPIVVAAMGWWAAHKQKPEVKLADVAALEGVQRIVVSPTAPPESPAAMAAADPSQPKVTSTAPVRGAA